MAGNYYITTPIYYVNDKPHIGHAYTSIVADCIARYHRMFGKNVHFLTGTDEHGQKVASTAEKNCMKTIEFADYNSAKFRTMTPEFNLSNDDFIRTTETRHIEAAQGFWNKLKENGYIYLSSYSGWYSVRDEAFYQESELVEGKAPTGAPVEWVEEPSYFFSLSKFEDKLLQFYEENPDFIWPKSRKNEVVNFVKSGLKDLSVSRTTFTWGVPVPGDEKHVMYVWLDALTNYISALGYPNENAEKMQNFWPADIHLVGKDILRFHAVYWPAFLMAAALALPKQVVAHGWCTNEGQKISKSLAHVIDPAELVSHYGLDQVRYFMLREVPFGQDGNYSKLSATRRVNSELANNIGNLAQRTLTMVQKNCEGRIPVKHETHDLIKQIEELSAEYFELFESHLFHEALECIVNIGNLANAYIDEMAPWKLKKENPEMMNTVLHHLIYAIRVIAILLKPIIPNSADKLLEIIGEDSGFISFKNLTDSLEEGKMLPLPQIVFNRIEEEAE